MQVKTTLMQLPKTDNPMKEYQEIMSRIHPGHIVIRVEPDNGYPHGNVGIAYIFDNKNL